MQGSYFIVVAKEISIVFMLCVTILHSDMAIVDVKVINIIHEDCWFLAATTSIL
jgi:hypothetical protein